MSGISTTDIPQGGGIPKLIQPSNVSAKIMKIYLDRPDFLKNGEYNLVMLLETPSLGDSFEGFYVDKDNPSKGRHKGQIGRVKAAEYAFSDGETKSGIKVERDREIMKFLQDLVKALGKKAEAWFKAQDKKHDTIELFVEQFEKDKPYKDVFLNWCIAGKEYEGKGGYTNYDLFLPRRSKDGVPFESDGVATEESRLYVFDKEKHVKKKKASKGVSNFEGEGENANANAGNGSNANTDFDLTEDNK